MVVAGKNDEKIGEIIEGTGEGFYTVRVGRRKYKVKEDRLTLVDKPVQEALFDDGVEDGHIVSRRAGA